jgi:hypothetical protein
MHIPQFTCRILPSIGMHIPAHVTYITRNLHGMASISRSN